MVFVVVTSAASCYPLYQQLLKIFFCFHVCGKCGSVFVCVFLCSLAYLLVLVFVCHCCSMSVPDDVNFMYTGGCSSSNGTGSCNSSLLLLQHEHICLYVGMSCVQTLAW